MTYQVATWKQTSVMTDPARQLAFVALSGPLVTVTWTLVALSTGSFVPIYLAFFLPFAFLTPFAQLVNVPARIAKRHARGFREGFVATVTIRQDGVVTGLDGGVLRIEGPELIFNGAYADWVLLPSMVERIDRETENDVALTLRGLSRPVVVRIEVFDSRHPGTFHLGHDLEGWAKEQSTAEGVFPPVEDILEQQVRWHRSRRALWSVAAACVASAALPYLLWAMRVLPRPDDPFPYAIGLVPFLLLAATLRVEEPFEDTRRPRQELLRNPTEVVA